MKSINLCLIFLFLISCSHKKRNMSLEDQCELNDPVACNDAGVFAYKEKRIRKAMELYEKSCELKLGLACSNRGCFSDPHTKCEKVLPTNIQKALEYYATGCILKSGPSCYNFGLATKRLKYDNASRMGFALGCSFGDLDACKESGGKRVSNIPEVIEQIRSKFE